MKRITTALLALALVLSSIPAHATVAVRNGSGYLGEASEIYFSTNTTVAFDGSRATVTASPATIDDFVFTTNSDTLSNATDDVLSFSSEDNTSEIRAVGFEAKAAYIGIWADEGDDNADKYRVGVSTSDVFSVDSFSTGAWVSLISMDTSGVLTLADSETLTNASDALTLTGDDNDTAFRVLGFEAKEGRLQLFADQDDDATDGWEFAASTSGTLTIGNDSSVAGTFVDKLTIDGTTGNVTLTGDIINENADSILMNTDDVWVFSSNDEVSTIRVLGFEAKAAQLQLWADQDDDATDGWYLNATTSGTFTLANDSSAAGTPVTKLTVTSAGVMTSAVGTVHTSGAAVALTPGAAVTLTVVPGRQLFTDTIVTDNEDQTINASGAGSAGDEMTIEFTTDTGGSGDEVITFGTNFLSTGTLTLANLTADKYAVTFYSNGTNWVEKCRTAVQTT